MIVTAFVLFVFLYKYIVFLQFIQNEHATFLFIENLSFSFSTHTLTHTLLVIPTSKMTMIDVRLDKKK